MIALFVDGPVRGSTRDIGASRASLLVGTGPDNIDRVIYNVHQFVLLNRVIRIASIHPLVDDIHLDDAFEFITSDMAKEAAVKRQEVPWQ
jgi:hypothetical protein